MDKNSEIDILLSKITFEGGRTFSRLYKKFVDANAPQRKIDTLMSEMITLGLIRKTVESDDLDLVILDSFGDAIKSSGGWSEHKKKELVEHVKETIKQQKEEKNKNVDRHVERIYMSIGILTSIGLLFFAWLSFKLTESGDDKLKAINRLKLDSIHSSTKILELENQIITKNREILKTEQTLDSIRLETKKKIR
jgi:hypothetical protein